VGFLRFAYAVLPWFSVVFAAKPLVRLPAGSRNLATQRSPSGYGRLTIPLPFAVTSSKMLSIP